MAFFSSNYTSYIWLYLAITIESFCALLALLNSNLSEFTVIFFVALFQATVIMCIHITSAFYKNIVLSSYLYESFYKIGRLGVLAGILEAIEAISFIIALLNTYTANVFLIAITVPLWVAIISFFRNNYIMKLRTIIATIICFACIGYVFYVDIKGESTANNDDVGSQGTNWFGNLMAVVYTITYSIYLTLIDEITTDEKNNDLSPTLIISTSIQIIVALIVGVEFTSVTSNNYGYLFTYGFILAVNDSIVIWAMWFIHPTEVAIYSEYSSVILQPLWVYIFGYSTPTLVSLIAGAIVIFTLFCHNYLELIDENDKNNHNNNDYARITDDDITNNETSSLSVETPTRK